MFEHCSALLSITFPSFHISSCLFFFFFFNDTATTEIYTLSLHDALPIFPGRWDHRALGWRTPWQGRSEEHTSELQSLAYLVCRLLLEKKKKKKLTLSLKKKQNNTEKKKEIQTTI